MSQQTLRVSERDECAIMEALGPEALVQLESTNCDLSFKALHGIFSELRGLGFGVEQLKRALAVANGNAVHRLPRIVPCLPAIVLVTRNLPPSDRTDCAARCLRTQV
jgi:hypothetical protein